MAVYIYREDCGEFEAQFEAPGDAAAEEHVLATWRSPSNPDFDGDSGSLARVDRDEEDGVQCESGVCSFDGEDMIADVDGMRSR